ncbi:MAG: deaminase [Desulfomicrobium escambiense]|nr:deaminase [Desulfomicrobium escambiense]
MRKSLHNGDGTITQHCVRTLHAEQNAFIQAARFGISLEGATLYCKMTPCRTCAMMIINAGITRVVCEKRHHADTDTINYFKEAGLELTIMNNELEQYKKSIIFFSNFQFAIELNFYPIDSVSARGSNKL